MRPRLGSENMQAVAEEAGPGLARQESMRVSHGVVM